MTWDIYFAEAFLTPPTVLVTAHYPDDLNNGPPVAAAVGIARHVTPNGFCLAARNSRWAGGSVGFHWMAIGCLKGCG